MVTLDWIQGSLKEKKRLDIAPYRLDSNTTTASSSPSLATPAVPAASTRPVRASKSATNAKRRAADDADEDEKVEKKIKVLKDKVAKASDAPVKIRQPQVDQACTLARDFSVYVDSEVAWNARLNQTEIGNNNNKFYLIQLLHTPTKQYAVFCHWGRVGARGQTSTDRLYDIDQAKSIFEKKFRDKTKNSWADRDKFMKHAGKYHLLPPDDGDSDDEDESNTKGKKLKEVKEEEEEEKPVPESKLHPKVQELMRVIFNTSMMNHQMKELDYDADKMPLGKLAKPTILHGYEVLKRIGAILDTKNPSFSELVNLSSEFYTVIPHNFGRRVPPVIKDAPTLKMKLEMLEALGEIEIAQKIMKENKKDAETITINPLDQQFASLKLNKLEPMDKSSERFKLIEKFVKNTHGSSHSAYSLVIDEVFDLDREGELERFNSSGHSKLHNRRLLWHGSRLTNYVGILSQGLRIAPPEAPVSGYMFDKGVYFADCVSKSANYCFTSGTNDTSLMLLCEVALGDMFKIEQSDCCAKTNSQKARKHSTKGCGLSYPDEADDVTIDDDVKVQVGRLKTEVNNQGFGYGYRLQYNEYIVYDTSQIKMRYLLKMKFDYTQQRRY
ncbi:poly polymerase catalytic domain-containing protein [Gamsiella multidivaricata]|uniref:poly polymerase catalytic domain-containing protein n=1 Tax=Gamsiella multidivaricata TaxID=101098 RepID=UPI002220AAC2|nr:poly polymerase catalytic domain-containing protein [Gamsiella multidivaricata]KAI7820300.1 poly polymerase catalytic domain-containing protein [Gamsiella multidivaricata]